MKFLKVTFKKEKHKTLQKKKNLKYIQIHSKTVETDYTFLMQCNDINLNAIGLVVYTKKQKKNV